jgi:cellobiose-specific phosphotransferase system component IIA
MTDLIRDDDLVKRLDELIRDQRGVDAETLIGVRQRLENLSAELAKRDEDVLAARMADADRRVEEEREAIAQWHDEQAKMYAERAQSAVEIGDHDLNSLMADHSQHHMMSASAIRSRSTREQVSDSSTACSTAAAPISQEQGEIAPEALSEGGE